MSNNTAAAFGRLALIAVGNYIAPGIGGVVGAPIGGIHFPKNDYEELSNDKAKERARECL